MRIRQRLTIWYGAVLALVLVVALWLAYDLHALAHDSEVDASLSEMASRAQSEIETQTHSGVPFGAIDLSAVHRAIDEPHAVWFLSDGRVVAWGGMVDDRAIVLAAVTGLSDGWHTQDTASGRVRSRVVPIGIGTIVVAADLARIDAANGELRVAYVLLGIAAVAVGMAVTSAIAGLALRPIATLNDTARGIAASRDFERRVHMTGDPKDELVTLARTFDEMLTSLDDAYRQQQRFVGDVSHELRTPLTTIRGHAELLATGELPPAAERDAVVRIARESTRVSRLVDELLVLARAEAAETLVPRPVHLDEVVMEVFDEMRIVAGERLRVRWIEAAVVQGERDRLKQLLLALVDNANRYTPAPGHIELSLSRDGADAVLRVDDEGIGIDDADMPRVFERFYRGAAAKRANGSGSGLGLAIVRWIVDRHRGSVRIERRETRGTSVLVRLPLAAPAPVTSA